MARTERRITYLTALMLLVMLIISFMFGGGVGGAYAATDTYTNVLDDLQRDSAFDIEKYPTNVHDNSVSVIQIAESVDRELFIYVYIPNVSAEFKATSVNMSLNKSATDTKIYTLTYLNSNGTLGKYKVDGFTVSKDTTRYYNISAIYRKWYTRLDGLLDNGNVGSEKSFKVGQLWQARTENGVTVYEREGIETVTITDKYIGFIRYGTRVSPLGKSYCDSHYVAFSTDWDMDELLSITLEFSSVFYSYERGSQTMNVELPPETVNFKYTDYFSYSERHLFYNKMHNLDRMYTVDEFIIAEKDVLDDTAKTKINNKQFVVRFEETDYAYTKNLIDGITETYTRVSDVTILRLEFMKFGTVYNLGVVDDKTSEAPDQAPDGVVEIGIWERFKKAVKTAPWWVWLIVGMVALCILLPVISLIFPAVGQVLKTVVKYIGIGLKHVIIVLGYGIKYIFIGLWWIVCLPFKGIKGIKALINKIRSKKQDKND